MGKEVGRMRNQATERCHRETVDHQEPCYQALLVDPGDGRSAKSTLAGVSQQSVLKQRSEQHMRLLRGGQ
jgi:hypothetical protein